GGTTVESDSTTASSGASLSTVAPVMLAAPRAGFFSSARFNAYLSTFHAVARAARRLSAAVRTEVGEWVSGSGGGSLSPCMACQRPVFSGHNSRMTTLNPVLRRTASVCLIGLIALGLAWELWLAPLRPGGSWLVLKVIPLLF